MLNYKRYSIVFVSVLICIFIAYLFLIGLINRQETSTHNPNAVTGNWNYANNVLVIDSTSDWTTFKNCVESASYTFTNKNVYLAANITISSVAPIGADATANTFFDGIFDGQNYSISYSNGGTYSGDHTGLFGYLENATIQNLNVTANITSSTHYTGGICAISKSTSFVNCIVSGTVAGDASDGNDEIHWNVATGGIVGEAFSSTITKCVNNSTVTARSNYTGGIAGALSGGTIQSCVNNGSVTAYWYAGGIVCNARTTTNTITQCLNTGTITVTNYCAAGIICGSNSRTTITYCLNTGNVKTNNTAGSAAGIFAFFFSGNNGSTVSFCANTGTISGASRVGGICGYYTNDNYSNNSTYCWNTGSATYPISYKAGSNNYSTVSGSGTYISTSTSVISSRSSLSALSGMSIYNDNSVFVYFSENTHKCNYLSTSFAYPVPAGVCQAYLEVINQDSSNISLTSAVRASGSGTTATIQASYTAPNVPVIRINNSGNYTMLSSSYSGQLDGIIVSATFNTSRLLTINLTGLSSGVPVSVYLDSEIAMLNVYNQDSSHISALNSERVGGNGSLVNISATFTNNYLPSIKIGDGVFFRLSNGEGSGVLNSYTFDYSFVNNQLILQISGFGSSEIADIYITSYQKFIVSVNLPNSSYANYMISYTRDNCAEVVLNCVAGKYIDSAKIDENDAVVIEYLSAKIEQEYNAGEISYLASNNGASVKLVFTNMTANINLSILFSNTQKSLSELMVTRGVVVESTNGGEARIIGADIDSLAMTDTIVFVAVPYKGFTFSCWKVGNTILQKDNGDPYGLSAAIPKSMVYRKIVTAVFVIDSSLSSLPTNDILISCATDLYLIMLQNQAGETFENRTFWLQKDIDMTATLQGGELISEKWKPLGENPAIAFAGVFYYNGYTISGISEVIRYTTADAIVVGESVVADSKPSVSSR